MEPAKLIPIEEHISFNASDRNSIFRILKEETGLNTNQYRCYLTEKYELLIFLVDNEEIEATINIKTLKYNIEKNSKKLTRVDIFAANTFDDKIFSIISNKENTEGEFNLKDFKLRMSATVMMPEGDERGRVILGLLERMSENTKFNKSLLSFLSPDTWPTSPETEMVTAETERVQSVLETVGQFKQDIANFDNLPSDFLNNLDGLVEFFEQELKRKKPSGLSELLFLSSPAPYSGHYAQSDKILYKHIHLKLYLLLYITYEQSATRELFKSKEMKNLKARSSESALGYLDRYEAGESIKSPKMKALIEQYQDTRLIRYVLQNSIGVTSRNVAYILSLFFDYRFERYGSNEYGELHKPINKYLEIMDFGKLTKMP
jgi:hypothetical protein